jgi:excisionase family DNA binding protein
MVLRQSEALKLLTIGEVASCLNVSRGCVYALVKAGRLPSYRVGIGRGAIRVSEEDLFSFLGRSRKQDVGHLIQSGSRPRLKHLSL